MCSVLIASVMASASSSITGSVDAAASVFGFFVLVPPNFDDLRFLSIVSRHVGEKEARGGLGRLLDEFGRQRCG